MRFKCGGVTGAGLPSDCADFMNPGDAGQSIPLVAAAFTPAGQPVLAVFLFGMWAYVLAAAADAGLVAPIVCPGVHVALLSSHIVFLRLGRRGPGGPGSPPAVAAWGPLVLFWCDVYRLITAKQYNEGCPWAHLHESKGRGAWPLLFGSEYPGSYNRGESARKPVPDLSDFHG